VEGIIVGVDDSEVSKDALRWALEEGRIHGSPVVALHAWQPPTIPPGIEFAPGGGAFPPTDLPALISEAEKTAKEFVERVVSDVAGEGPEVDVRAVAIEDAPATALVEAAKGADLLVVGSRGLGGFKELLLGSVSHQVAQHAPCPVVIYRRSASD
jgi:nucleotide-binding universal stress UspA family protein